MSSPKLAQIPADIAAVADYSAYARERLGEQAWAYLAGGAADELTLQTTAKPSTACACAAGFCRT